MLNLSSNVFVIWQSHHSFSGVYTKHSVDDVGTDGFQQMATQLGLKLICVTITTQMSDQTRKPS